ncbi:protein of unknown function [Faunimonas pinastri]|uniref:DUF4396 domain-containing protein n=1 Tax=Faunimonas pinastri TaxID=1855383 RepID=A0A1H9NC96_9HYPH|nr:DUF4396 domain-containing protein [Faunimonas pinastri]SER33289.1 protein of unknown function [Faunimonas pinastri]
MTPASFPTWLHSLAIVSLILGFICAIVIIVDEFRRPQHMWIMNVVWPLTALFGSVIWLAFYFAWGRGMTRERHQAMQRQQERKKREGSDPDGGMDMGTQPPFPVMVAKGASHCGAGCTLGDIVAEWLAFGIPAVAVAFGWHSLFDEKTFAVWILDYIVAFLLGVIFQYFTIKPMRDLSVGQGIVQALKADVLSISAWQIGMYGFMAIAQFAWLNPAYGHKAEVNSPEFWFVMQVAMLCGFVTSYPVNWFLLKAGVKEKM